VTTFLRNRCPSSPEYASKAFCAYWKANSFLCNWCAKGKQIGRRKGQKVRSKLDKDSPAIISEIKLGVPYKTIAKRYGVAVSTVTRWAIRNDVYEPKQTRKSVKKKGKTKKRKLLVVPE